MFFSIPTNLTATPVATLSPAIGDPAGMGVVFILFAMFALVICLASVILWIYVLIKILSSNVKKTEEKILWLVVVLVLPFLGSILYLLLGRDKIKGKLKN